MFPSRASEGDRKTLPPISSLSSHDPEFSKGEPHPRSTTPGGRAPLRTDELGRERRPPSVMDHRRTPPAGPLPRLPPPREMEPTRVAPFPRPGDEPYGPPMSSKFAHTGPPPFHRDHDRGSPTSEEGGWRSYDRPDSRFAAAKDPYSPRMPPAPYGARDDARLPPWQHPSDDPHRPRMPAPPGAMRDEGPWRSGPQGHPDAFARERAMEEERWREERGARPAYPYETGPSYGSMPPYPQDARSGGRPLDTDLSEEGRRIRPRAASSLMDDEQNAQRYAAAGARPYGAGPYSPPEPRRHSAAPGQGPMRPGMMAGMEPPRPNSTHGVMSTPAAAGTSVAPQQPAPPTTVNANRRVAHLLSEQKRRESINTGFEDLRQAIPACRDGQDSKATILKRALEYIRELEGVVDRQHRMPMESHPLGSYSNHRSPPDDKDDLRRFGRPGGDDERRGADSGRQMAGGSGSSNSSEAGNGPRVGGLPSNAFANGPAQGYPHASAPPHHYRPYGSPHMSAPTEPSRAPVNGSADARAPGIKRWAEDSDEDDRSPSRRRVSDGDKDDVQRSPAGPNYLVAPPPRAHARSPLIPSPTMDKSRDWHPRMDNRSLVDSAVRV